MIKEVRKGAEPVFLCSAGDFYGTGDVFNEPKSHFISRVMVSLDYDAVGVGEMDLGYGVDKLASDVQLAGLNVTCANLVVQGERTPVAADTPSGRRGLEAARAHGTVFPPYLVVERDGLRVGFFSLLSPHSFTHQASATDEGEDTSVQALTWSLEDPRAAALGILDELDGECDLIVLLAHMDRDEAEELLPALPGVDIVVLGHNGRPGAEGDDPPLLGGARLVRATARGQYVGEMHATLGRKGGLTIESNRVHFLGEDYADDAATVVMLDAFDEQNRKEQKLLYAQEQVKGHGRMTADNVYLGLGSCQSCHHDAFDVYVKTGHAHAYATLAAGFVHRDTNCVGCHVTGYDEAGGFAGMRLRNSPVDLIDVQCEACHGPGVEHTRDGTYRARAIASCVRCHTPHEDPEFDFARDWEKIRH